VKEITLPVSRLTRAMMLRRYGAEPIRLDNNDIRRREMMTVGSSDKHHQRKQYSLNTTITLTVNRHEFKHMDKKRPEIGFHWYEADKRRMFLFIWGRVTGGLPATHAIHDYYSMHNIEEDDFPMDTSERLWKRWRAEKEKTVPHFSPCIVPSDVAQLLSEKQALRIYDRVSKMIDEDIAHLNGNFTSSTIKAWILCDLGGVTHKDASLIVGRRRDVITRSLKLFRSYLNYNQDLRKIVAYCVATTRARPTPST
jgi:hypothetical protein